MKTFNKKKKDKHTTKQRWVKADENEYWFSWYYCKSQSVDAGVKFKFSIVKLTNKFEDKNDD